MKTSPLVAAALSTILGISFSDPAADEFELRDEKTFVDLSSDEFQSLIATAKSMPLGRQSAPLRKAVEAWTMSAYGAEIVTVDGSDVIEATIFFESDEDFGPVIVCSSPADAIEWTECNDATISLKKGCT